MLVDLNHRNGPAAKYLVQKVFGPFTGIPRLAVVGSESRIRRNADGLTLPLHPRRDDAPFLVSNDGLIQAKGKALRRSRKIILGMKEGGVVLVVGVLEDASAARGAPTKAIDPMNLCRALVVTPAPVLLKCVIDRTPIRIRSATSPTGSKTPRTSAFLWLSACPCTNWTGSMLNSMSLISPIIASSKSRSVCKLKAWRPLPSSNSAQGGDDMDLGQIGLGSHKARHHGVGLAIFSAQDDDAAERRTSFAAWPFASSGYMADSIASWLCRCRARQRLKCLPRAISAPAKATGQNQAGHARYPIVVLALGTGMRRGELLALRWENLTLRPQPWAVCVPSKRPRLGSRFKTRKDEAWAAYHLIATEFD